MHLRWRYGLTAINDIFEPKGMMCIKNYFGLKNILTWIQLKMEHLNLSLYKKTNEMEKKEGEKVKFFTK